MFVSTLYQDKKHKNVFKKGGKRKNLTELFIISNNINLWHFKNFAEIGCTHDSSCPLETACINGVCKNPCSEHNSCQGGQECQVHNHEMVCVKGKKLCSKIFLNFLVLLKIELKNFTDFLFQLKLSLKNFLSFFLL